MSELEGAVFLITGPPAAGKSTVAGLLAKRFAKGVHVPGDVFRRMVVSGREDMGPNASADAWRQLRLRYRLGAMMADAYVAAGFTVVLQDVVAGPVLTEYAQMIQSRPLFVVVLMPRVDALRDREAQRDKTGYDDGWSVQDFDTGFATTTPRMGLWIDSSEQTAEESVAEIMARALTDAAV